MRELTQYASVQGVVDFSAMCILNRQYQPTKKRTLARRMRILEDAREGSMLYTRTLARCASAPAFCAF
jgi:hypothetical protein